MSDRILGVFYHSPEVKAGVDFEGKAVVEITAHRTNVNVTERQRLVLDRASAAKLINQLRRALDN